MGRKYVIRNLVSHRIVSYSIGKSSYYSTRIPAVFGPPLFWRGPPTWYHLRRGLTSSFILPPEGSGWAGRGTVFLFKFRSIRPLVPLEVAREIRRSRGE